jgi:LAS superfamily LD-carboxypeptidase LdcB
MGKFDPATDTSFVRIEKEYADNNGMFMKREAYDAFRKMHEAALKDGISLRILSATRNFSSQKQIWEDKWNGRTLVGGKNLSVSEPDPVKRALQILTYSSMPTTSRHHWGTDIDLNSLVPEYFNSGTGKNIYDWLVAHAGEFGFGQPYTAKDSLRPDGYNEEKWHWSYLPISKKNLSAYGRNIHYEMIEGFTGSETAEKIQVIRKYVEGINAACK